MFNRMKIFPILLLGFLLIFGTLYAQTEFIEQLRGGVPGPITKVVCPFNLTRSHVIEVPVTINDCDQEFTFVFDTAGNTMIGWDLAEQLRLEIDSMATPMQTMYLSKIDEIIAGGLTVEDFTLSVMDFKKTFEIGNDELEGMIGPDFIRFYRTTINYQTNQLLFENNDVQLTAKTPDQHLLDMEIMMPYHPSIQMQIADFFPIMGRIDTGLHYGIVLPIIYIENLPEEEQGKLVSCKGYFARWPLVDSHENYLYKCPEITVGDMVFKDVGIIFANFPFNNSALIGKDFLEQFVTTLDFPNRKVLLSKVEGSSKDVLYSTGINVRKLDDGTFKIVGIWEGSPADAAGVELDDIITEVNGNPANDVDTGEFYLMRFDTNVKDLKLKIHKAGSEDVREIVLKKEYLGE
ncbi:MAG: aspartyl protease family protein [Candidatus Cloacimonetes bacterium]|nr:aspartyl protease family protein [Candidatus Cloacimonadota bacterium]